MEGSRGQPRRESCEHPRGPSNLTLRARHHPVEVKTPRTMDCFPGGGQTSRWSCSGAFPLSSVYGLLLSKLPVLGFSSGSSGGLKEEPAFNAISARS